MLNQDVVAPEAPADSRGAWELGWPFRVDLNQSEEGLQIHLSFLQVSHSVYNFLDLWLFLPGFFHVQSLGPVWLFVTPWCVACQAPLSMGLSRQEYWSGFCFPLPGDLPDPEIEPASLESRSVMSHSLWPHWLYSLWDSSSKNTGVGSFSLLQGIFPTQGSNPGLLCCRQIL